MLYYRQLIDLILISKNKSLELDNITFVSIIILNLHILNKKESHLLIKIMRLKMAHFII